MHPPFFVPDLEIGAAPDPHASPQRRHAPRILRLRPVGGPPDFAQSVFSLPEQPAASLLPGPRLVRPELRLVPPPSRGIRAWFGRWLIRTGQNLLLPAAAGN